MKVKEARRALVRAVSITRHQQTVITMLPSGNLAGIVNPVNKFDNGDIGLEKKGRRQKSKSKFQLVTCM